MAVESNINMYYEELIESLAERAFDSVQYVDDDVDETELIWQAIDDGLIYYTDQAYIVAHALQNGFIEWGKEPLWDEITEMLYSDVSEALEELKKGEEDDEE